MSRKKKKNKRDEFLAMVPEGAKRILDLGCGDGRLGSMLKIKEREVVGIEKNDMLCEAAAEKLDRVFSVDMENFVLPYPKEYFDCILCADVLEHLIEPLVFLEKCKEYLSEDGFILASIPNIRYYKVIGNLIFSGTWDYMEQGILDRTHLRFFTLINIKELFIDAGYEIIDIKRNIVAASLMRFLNRASFGRLKEFLTYQYYIKAEKSGVKIPVKKRKTCQF
ncbi:MAG: class I SAM-dependent methyltransferase [Candidatus Omnitrophota bacterium]|nr:MAG: class I SAM-dependent methyltransferase [Candidatus Omnitrophota bacterium]